MKICYEKKEAMTFIGFHTEILPGEGYRKCPEFWGREYNERFSRLWQTMKPETPLEAAIVSNDVGSFAICSESANGFSYWIAGPYRGGEVPEGLELYSFPAGSWATFSTKGPMPDALQALNSYVWQEWFPTEGKKRGANDMATLEVYSAGDPISPDYESGIWVQISEDAL